MGEGVGGGGGEGHSCLSAARRVACRTDTQRNTWRKDTEAEKLEWRWSWNGAGNFVCWLAA